MKKIRAAVAAAALVVLSGCAVASAEEPTPSPTPSPTASPTPVVDYDQAVAVFTPGVTDGLRPVGGTVTFWERAGYIGVYGFVANLQPNTPYVAVPYLGKGCAPAPGVTAFPSSPFTTDSVGTGSFSATVNPRAINPLGQFHVLDTGSVSIRQVLVNQVSAGPVQGPPVPNIAVPEACDENPTVTAKQ